MDFIWFLAPMWGTYDPDSVRVHVRGVRVTDDGVQYICVAGNGVTFLARGDQVLLDERPDAPVPA